MEQNKQNLGNTSKVENDPYFDLSLVERLEKAYELIKAGDMKATDEILNIEEFVKDEENEEAANFLNMMGQAFIEDNEYEKGLLFFKKALEINKRIFGELHGVTLTSYNNVGSTYMKLSQYEKALPMFEKALESRKTSLSVIDCDSLAGIIMHWISICHEKLGDYEKALEYLQRSLNIMTECFNTEENELIAGLYGEVASLYFTMGDNEKSLENEQKALEIRLKVLGEENPDTIRSIYNVGARYRDAGEIGKAMDYIGRAHHIMKIKQDKETKSDLPE